MWQQGQKKHTHTPNDQWCSMPHWAEMAFLISVVTWSGRTYYKIISQPPLLCHLVRLIPQQHKFWRSSLLYTALNPNLETKKKGISHRTVCVRQLWNIVRESGFPFHNSCGGKPHWGRCDFMFELQMTAEKEKKTQPPSFHVVPSHSCA